MALTLWSLGTLGFILAVALSSIDSHLRAAAPDVSSVWRVLQTTTSGEKVRALLSNWDDVHRARLRIGFLVDNAFVAIYGAFCAGIAIWAGKTTVRRWKKWKRVRVATLILTFATVSTAIAGASFDLFENSRSLEMLGIFDSSNLVSDQLLKDIVSASVWKWILLKVWFFGFALLALLAVYRSEHLLRLLCKIWMLRVPLLIAILLTIIPSLAEEMTRGAYDTFKTKWNAYWVGVVVGALIFTIWRTAVIIMMLGDERAHLPPFLQYRLRRKQQLKWYFFLLACLAAVPSIAKLLELTKENGESVLAYFGSVLLGVASAFAATIARLSFLNYLENRSVANLQAIQTSKASPKAPGGFARTIQKLIQRFSERVWAGYFVFTPVGNFVEPEQIKASVFALLSTIAFVVFSILPAQRVPAFLYIALLLMAACWILSSLSFFGDRFRIPILLPLFIWIFVVASITNHDYEFTSREALTNSIRLTPAHAVMARNTSTPVVVAVCGGGIHSGAWGVFVLTELERILLTSADVMLSRHITCASGISGGSYGLMQYLSAYSNQAIPTSELEMVRKRVTASSLGSAVHGLVCKDLPRTLLPWVIKADRGAAMESAWLRSFDVKDPPPSRYLSEWEKDSASGLRPVGLFGTTSIESGRAITLSTSGRWPDEDAYLQAMDVDVPVVSAARMSASFPFVSPVARPSFTSTNTTHLADGGYYDNHGIVALTRWLDHALQETNSPTNLLVIVIRYEKSTTGPSGEVTHGPLFQLLAPFSGLLNVRKTAQDSNAELLLDMLAAKYPNKKIRRATFPFHGSAALSWHLTQADIQNLWRQANSLTNSDNPCFTNTQVVIDYLKRQ